MGKLRQTCSVDHVRVTHSGGTGALPALCLARANFQTNKLLYELPLSSMRGEADC